MCILYTSMYMYTYIKQIDDTVPFRYYDVGYIEILLL